MTMSFLHLTIIIAVSIAGIAFTCCNGKILTIEAETAKGAHSIHFRSDASGQKAVWLRRNEMMTLSFCLIRRTTISVQNVYFSNDGGADTCSVSIDGELLGHFNSESGSNYGQLWNIFKPSGIVGPSFELEGGWNIISINVASADNFGIEVDRIEIDVSDTELSDDIISCRLPCLDQLPVLPTSYYDIKPGKAVQRSYQTQCTEEDNVHVAIFNKDVKEFEISASLPQYRSFVNLREKNTEHCDFVTPVYWLYENVKVSPISRALSSKSSQLQLSQQQASDSRKINKMVVTFSLKGRKSGSIDSEIGSTLFLTMKTPTTPVEVVMSYEHRNGSIVQSDPIIVTHILQSNNWNIPDFTWKEDALNKIILTVKSSMDIELRNFRMERRYMKPDQVIKIYSSDLIVVEGIRIDFWWQAPAAMQLVRPSTGESWNNLAYFRIYISQPWSKGFSQVFVLYQDGNMRLLNPPPRGLDWTPFGTSVIIGQTNVNDFRPVASIIRVEMEPRDRSMILTYADDSSVRLTIVPSLTKTILYVSEINFKKDTNIHPFATFRSTYITTGNCDADSIVSDLSETKQILDGGWKEINGTTFLVYRRCESNHLTQSPDIKLEITKT